MEDTKKLIEKYKRELMELSRTVRRDEPTPARTPQIIGYVDNVDEKTFNEAAMSAATEKRDTCGDKQQSSEERVLSAPEPRVESEPELPYHHEPEVPPPDYSDQEYVEPVPMPTPEPRAESIPMPAPRPRVESVPMPNPAPSITVSPEPNSMNEPTSPQTESAVNEAPRSADFPQTESANGEAATHTEEYEPPFVDPQMAQNAEGSARYPDLEQNGSQSQPTQFPEPQYTSFEDFQSKNSGRGTMVFRITTAREALPVEGAKCVLTKKFGGIIYEIDTLFTDRSGQTAPRTLPAPPKSLSQQYDNLIQPFALYDATVTRDGYVDVVLTDIPVFDGVQSVQRVSMLPSISNNIIEDIQEVNDNAR